MLQEDTPACSEGKKKTGKPFHWWRVHPCPYICLKKRFDDFVHRVKNAFLLQFSLACNTSSDKTIMITTLRVRSAVSLETAVQCAFDDDG